MKVYFLFQWGAFWLGAHYSTEAKRLCINFLPLCTICFVQKDGTVPRQVKARQEKALKEMPNGSESNPSV